MGRIALVPLLLAAALAFAPPPARAEAPFVVINEFLPAPAGGNEWAELLNIGDGPAELSGWRIDDDLPANSVWAPLPAGATLQPGERLVVEWSASLLNNGGDTIQLLAPGNVVVDSYTYGAAPSEQSFARQPDGAGTWAVGAPTRGLPNSEPRRSAGYRR